MTKDSDTKIIKNLIEETFNICGDLTWDEVVDIITSEMSEEEVSRLRFKLNETAKEAEDMIG